MSVLITGGRGQLGSDLAELLGEEAVPLAHADLDICDERAVAAAIAEHRPRAVINCAAFHVVDAMENEEGRAFEVNVGAVRSLARESARAGARFVHYSSNYVFDGRRSEPYGEEDVPNPRSVYAISKLAGEHMALAYAPEAIVIRSSGLYGAQGNASKGGNFPQRMLARAREQGTLTMVTDQRLTPTYTPDLAVATLEALDRGATGVLHLTNGGECSWHEFTLAILEEAGVEAGVNGVTTTVPEGGAARPLNGVLARPRADALGLTPLRPWREALADYLSS